MTGILHINTEFGWRGGENQLAYLLEGLESSSFQNHLLASEGSEVATRLSPKVKTKTVRAHMGHTYNIAKDVVAYCQTTEIKLISAHNSAGHNIGIVASMLNPNLKLVVHRRVDNRPNRSPYHRYKYKCRHVSRYITVSQFIAQGLMDYGIPPEKIQVVYSGIKSDFWQPKEKVAAKKNLAEKLNINPNLPWIGNASALTRQKGYHTFVDSMARLKNLGLPFRALIAGEGYLRESLENQVKEFGLANEVRFLGYLNDTGPLLKALDILLVPSRNEGLGTVLLEGIAAGCYVVGHNVGGIPEIIKDGKTGFLANPKRPEHIADITQEILENPRKWEDLKASATEHVKENFQASTMIVNTREIYESVLAP